MFCDYMGPFKMKSFSIVIPTYNHYDLLHARLYDIFLMCHNVSEVVVVDDASTDTDYAKGIEWWKTNKMLKNLRHLRMKQNGGFILSSNAGIKRATGDVICLLSSDVKLRDDFVTPSLSIFESNPKSLVGNRLIDWDSGWNTFDGKTFPYLEGWMMTTTREGWEELGYLDVDLAPHDFEDVSLSTKALELGYNVVPLNNEKIQHMGGQTIGFNPEREAITNRNREIFRTKYVR